MKSVALCTGPATHLDHLGVLASLLQIPVIVTDEKTYALGKSFYPQIDLILKDEVDLSLEYLATEFDLILETGKFWALELGPVLELLFQKKMRFAFCPHGNSDKGHSLEHVQHPVQDISFVYGDHMVDLLKRTGAFGSIAHPIVTGNYRYPFYLHHREFYDELAREHLLKRLDPKKKTLFYAPTWKSSENPASFQEACALLIEQLPKNYNLLIKLHPFLMEDHPAHVIHLLARYENHPSLLFIEDFPAIYPLLSFCDGYIGDFSSIGFDFLAFDKPLYFLGAPQDPKLILPHCGVEIPHEKRADIYGFIEETWDENRTRFAQIRKQTLLYAFGPDRSPSAIKHDLSTCL